MANDGRSPEPAAPKLRVSFEQSGGFAGLLKSCVLDADELPADESAELRRLVAASGLETSSEAASRGMRDRRQLAITIDRGGERVEIVCDDGSTPEDARPLVAFLVARAKPVRP
jgi:hypothetical protein